MVRLELAHLEVLRDEVELEHDLWVLGVVVDFPHEIVE